MGLIKIIIKSLGDSVNPRRFLPFFLLYFIFLAIVLVLTKSLLQVLPSLIVERFTERELSIAMIDVVTFLIVLPIAIGINLWFTGALISDLHTNKGFKEGLKRSKKLYLKMVFLSSLLFIFIILSGLFGDFSFIIRIIIDWIFMFSLVSIIIMGDGAQKSLTRSYNIVRKNVLKTLAFFFLTYATTFLILFLGIILVSISVYPLFLDLSVFGDLQTLSPQKLVRIIDIALGHYPSFALASIISSLFLSFANVFVNSSRTYYFLSFKKK